MTDGIGLQTSPSPSLVSLKTLAFLRATLSGGELNPPSDKRGLGGVFKSNPRVCPFLQLH